MKIEIKKNQVYYSQLWQTNKVDTLRDKIHCLEEDMIRYYSR